MERWLTDRPGPASSSPPRLLDQVRDAVRRRHYSYRTEQAYIHWIRRFIYFNGVRHPRELGEPEVTAFLNHLARDRQVASSTQNQALSTLLFLHREVLATPLERHCECVHHSSPVTHHCECVRHLFFPLRRSLTARASVSSSASLSSHPMQPSVMLTP